MANTNVKQDNPVVARCLEFWGIRKHPFGPNCSPGEMFLSTGAEEALVRLDYIVTQRYAGALLVGRSGVGKTLLLRRAAQDWRRQRREVVFLNATGQDRFSLATALACELGSDPGDGSTATLWREVRDRVMACLWSHEACVVICDDVTRGENDVSGFLSALGQIRHRDRRPIVIGSCRYEEVHHPVVHHQSWFDMQIEIQPWSAEEVQVYLRERLLDAGADPDDVITEVAMDRLAELTGGNPRDVNRLAEWCLLVAAGAEVRPIEPDLVMEVFEEFYSRLGEFVPSRL
jgi:type II secretory pathway predicted ATPase ExeA